jgi:homocysteine S-methyltransferase
MNLLDELERRFVCGDGAMGTLLLGAGVSITRCFEEMCVSAPGRIQAIHEEYVAAGAEVIQTNTFGANAVRLGRFGMEDRVSEINRAAVAVAKQAVQNRDLCIAGSVGPLGISTAQVATLGVDRAHCFQEQVTALLEAGADLIFFQTFTDFAELEIALRAKQAVGDAPEICSFACGPDGYLRCGTSIVDAFAEVRKAGGRIAGLNCMNEPQGMTALLDQCGQNGPMAVYPTAGDPIREGARLAYHLTPKSFAASAADMLSKGARLLGGCCGTTPAHIAALACALRDREPR